MCLTGVDYFSTLGYQPGIAALAAGYLSPFATLVLVLVTLFAALPVYRQVAGHSPDGQGSISMLERLFPSWWGKAVVLCLLGFAATDFIITMTLSAADATAHILENPFAPQWLEHRVGVTLLLIAILAGVFLVGFKEAIGVAVGLVGVYLALNFIVVVTGAYQVVIHVEALEDWKRHLFQAHGNPGAMVALSMLLFPKLALGLSGFETGVAVMPLVRGGRGDTDQEREGRIRNTRKLLLAAALIMSTFLLASSLITTLLIPHEKFERGGEANGRALAYVAHKYLGAAFGTAYDMSTILILSFAGASAMAGLLNLVPRFLPRYGMAPDWARASRPLVLVFAAIAFAVTILFDADVDAQGGAYATGVLVLMSSAAVAVTSRLWNTRGRYPFVAISVIFLYTTVVNIIERPEGIRIASFFIALTVAISLLSRALRSTELRARKIVFTDAALALLATDNDQIIRIIAHRPRRRTEEEYDRKDSDARMTHHLGPQEVLIFLEVEPCDASEFDTPLHVDGLRVGRHRVLRTESPAIPNAIAAILIQIGRITGKLPHAYFGWTEGNPIGYVFRFLFLGEGDVAPITREVLRKRLGDPKKRPSVHVS
jgi:hypothetical protein